MYSFTCGLSHLDDDPSLFGRCTFQSLVERSKRPLNLRGENLTHDGSTRNLKAKAHWFLPSDCPSKKKDDVVKHGNYCLLVADIDEGNLRQVDIGNALRALEVNSFIIYDTISSTPENRRSRVVIELANPVCVETWMRLQRSLIYLFDSDNCTLKPNQISYLPTISILNQSCYRVTYSEGFPLDPERSHFALEAKSLEAEQPEKLKLTPERHKSPPPSFNFDIDEYRDPIGVFNQVHDWNCILEFCGIKRVGSRLLPPTSKSGVPGAIISYKHRTQGAYLSSHTSDPLADGLAHDKFDVWMVHYLGLDHRNRGDVINASTTFARNYRLPDGYTLERKNRYIYSISQKRHSQQG